MANPTLAILNGRIWSNGPATAIALAGDRIVAVGSDREIRSLCSAETRILDAAVGSVLPGFNDAHVHLESSGGNLLGIDLREARDEADFARRLGRYLADQPAGRWIRRGIWDHENWPSHRLPTRQVLDPVSPRHPVFLSRLDGHVAVANSLALAAAKIDRHTADPAGGRIGRESDGTPNGLFFDTALALIRQAMPAATESDRLEAIETGLRHAAAHGLTSLQAMCGTGEYDLLRRLEQSGRLPIRVRAILPPEVLDGGTGFQPVAGRQEENPQAESLCHLKKSPQAESLCHQGFLRTGAIKLFADGSFGAATALLFEPYDDRPDSSGLAIYEPGQLEELIGRIDAAGLQAAVHAIGDRAVDRVLTAFERVLAAGGRRQARHRIEHAQMVRPADRARFGAAGLIASIQPSHCIDDLRWISNRLGGRCRMAYPYRSLAAAGAPIALGTDWDVEPLNPMLTLYAAITRQTTAGDPPAGWFADETVTLAQAIRDYTFGSAYAEFAEADKGTLEPGKLADLVILSRDIAACAPAELLATRPRATIAGGRVVFEA